jgi:Fe-S-cluster containining protein
VPAGAATPGSFGASDAFAFLAGARPAPPPPVPPRPKTTAPPPSTTPSDKSPFRALFVATQNRIADALRGGRSPAAVAQAVADGATLSDGKWAEMRPAIESRRQPGFACTAGCAWCCHQQVALEPVEAIAIARHVDTKFTPEERTAVRQRIDALAGRTKGMNNLAWARLKTPCAFLVEGQCSIYEVRPLRCRAVFSRDADHCRWAMENPDAYFDHRAHRLGSGPYPLEPRHIIDAALTGFAVAERDFGLSWKTLTLMAAIKILLDQPDAAERYLAGEAVLAPALLPEDEDTAPVSPAPASPTLANPNDSH